MRLYERRVNGVFYDQLATEVSGVGRTAVVARLDEIRAAVLAIRRRKSMILNETDINHRSAGSFFLNPVVPASRSVEVADRFRVLTCRELPLWPLDDSSVKISAAALIEGAGFSRGYRLGRAAISTNHPLALVNRGGATTAELLCLASLVRDRVAEIFDVVLTPEPTLVGVELGPPLGSEPAASTR